MKRIVETAHGKMLVNDLDPYVGRMLIEWGEFSRGEIEAFRHFIRPGMSVADVGANIGAHTLVFSELVGATGRVLAFEPQRMIFQMLCANAAINARDNIYAYQCAIGAERGEIMLHSLDHDVEQNFGGIELQMMAGGNERVEIRPLTETCDFIKIDVEGMEYEVLCGAEEMIRKCQPVLFVENEKEEKAQRLIDKVRSLGYTPYWYTTPFFDPKNPRGVKDNMYKTNLLTFNMICLPPHRAHEVDLPICDCSHVELMARWAAAKKAV